jgi:hypothetical protein
MNRAPSAALQSASGRQSSNQKTAKAAYQATLVAETTVSRLLAVGRSTSATSSTRR